MLEEEGIERQMIGDNWGRWRGISNTARLFFVRVGGVYIITVLAISLVTAGCARRDDVHPGLRIERREDIDRAIQRGRGFLANNLNYDDVYAGRLQDINLRITSSAVLRSAGLCLPEDMIAYEICRAGDTRDDVIRRAVANAQERMRRELVCVAVVQIPKSMEPEAVEFTLRTTARVEYPAMAVEQPIFIREVEPVYDPSAEKGAMYYYTVKFPVRGGLGIPPIGPTVNGVTLVVKVGGQEASAYFPLPRPQYR